MIDIDPSFHDLSLPGSFEDAGFAYGKACREVLRPARVRAYLGELMRINRTTPDHLAVCAARWCGTLPAHYQRQMAAMADGAGASFHTVQQWLYADIAAAAPPPTEPDPTDPVHLISQAGPMCTGLVVFDRGRPWVGRNCDWYPATLSRGTAAVRHAVPHRIPIMALGIMGDIDCDTGLNAEGLWLHMHTLLARDEPRAGVSCISWLFWMREALETCATLADVERFIAATDRDRGVILFAADGKSGEAAIYECTRSSFTRVDAWAGADGVPRLMATNHCRHKHPPDDPARARPAGGTVTRYHRLSRLLDHAHPEHLPDDVQELLADEGIEMGPRHPGSLRTIYSAVADPARRRVWFAAADGPGVAAASGGQWQELALA